MPQSPKQNGPTSDVWANQIIQLTRAVETQLYRVNHGLDTMHYADLRPALVEANELLSAIKAIALSPPLPFG